MKCTNYFCIPSAQKYARKKSFWGPNKTLWCQVRMEVQSKKIGIEIPQAWSHGYGILFRKLFWSIVRKIILKMASGETICPSYECLLLLGIFLCLKNAEPCWSLVKLSQSFSDIFHNSFNWQKLLKPFIKIASDYQ